MLKRNSVNVHSNTNTACSAKVRTGWPYILGDFGNFFNCLATVSYTHLTLPTNREV